MFMHDNIHILQVDVNLPSTHKLRSDILNFKC